MKARASNEILECDHVAPNILREVNIMCIRLCISFRSLTVILKAREPMLLSPRRSIKQSRSKPMPIVSRITPKRLLLGTIPIRVNPPRASKPSTISSSFRTTAITMGEFSRGIQRQTPLPDPLASDAHLVLGSKVYLGNFTSISFNSLISSPSSPSISKPLPTHSLASS